MLLERLPDGAVRARASAKINLYLEILGKRPDGYHEIDTIIQEVSIHDEIEVRWDQGAVDREPRIRFSVISPEGQGSQVPENDENLVVRAARLFLSTEPSQGSLPRLDIRLTKRIPVGAGLGGGSSDAAATLAALSRLFGENRSPRELCDLAAQLGSDVPFFLHGGTARCQGRGEKVRSLRDIVGDETFHYILFYPGFQVSTALIYRELDQMGHVPSALTTGSPLDTMDLQSLKSALKTGEIFANRLESVAFKVFPDLEFYKKEIQKEPLIATLMSGSGSTIFGLAGGSREAEEISNRIQKRIGGRVFVATSERETGLV